MVQPNYEKLTITNCSYVCKTNEKVEEVTEFERKRRQIVNEIEKADNSPESDSDYDYDNNNNTSDENEPKPEKYSRVHYSFSPHICHDKGSFTNCYVSLNYKQKITLKNVESSFKINTEVPDQCLYPMSK
jgi:GTPase SAR1 family protein